MIAPAKIPHTTIINALKRRLSTYKQAIDNNNALIKKNEGNIIFAKKSNMRLLELIEAISLEVETLELEHKKCL